MEKFISYSPFTIENVFSLRNSFFLRLNWKLRKHDVFQVKKGRRLICLIQDKYKDHYPHNIYYTTIIIMHKYLSSFRHHIFSTFFFYLSFAILKFFPLPFFCWTVRIEERQSDHFLYFSVWGIMGIFFSFAWS